MAPGGLGGSNHFLGICSYDNMSVSNTRLSSDDLDNVETSSSSPDTTSRLPLWSWALADNQALRFSPLPSDPFSEAIQNYDLVPEVGDESTALTRSVGRHPPRARTRSPGHSLQPRPEPIQRLSGMLSVPSAIINFLDTEVASHSHQSRVVIVDHERGIRTSQNLFFDFFGGGDSSEAILEYYRRQILNAMTVENPMFRSRDIGYIRNE